jgi:hypothetical protein
MVLALGHELTSQIQEVIMLRSVDGLDLATNVELLSCVVEVADSRMLGVTSEDFFRLQLSTRPGLADYPVRR